MNDSTLLNDMHNNKNSLFKEAIWRKRTIETVSVGKGSIKEYRDKGFEVSKELIKKTVLTRAWPHDKQLENKVWTLFYKLGYPEISKGYDFKIRVKIKNEGSAEKSINISILAKDDETAIVAKCRSSESPKQCSLKKDIDEFAALKGPISNSINKYYSSNPKHSTKLKIIWLFVTNNILWSSQDRQLADRQKIHIIIEKELPYYLQIAEHLKLAARYQFLAEFLKEQKIPALEKITVPAIQGELGGKPFFSFISTPRQMLKIAFVNHRALNDPEGAPSYQRLIAKTRLNKIAKFLENGGFFPTNILVNFNRKCTFDLQSQDKATGVNFGKLHLPCYYCSAWVIDGQHRLYGYTPLDDHYLDQNIMVVAFENLDKNEEANLFVTINHEQKPVQKNLLDELEGDLKWGSSKPKERIGAMSSRLISRLNEGAEDPLFRKVARQGIAPTATTCLTVPQLKNGIKMSKLIGISDSNGKNYIPGPLSGSTDYTTLDRAQETLNGFLSQIKNANQAIWDAGKRGLLCTNIGIQGLMLFFSTVIDIIEQEDSLNARELEPSILLKHTSRYCKPIIEYLENSTVDDINSTLKIVYGSSGPREYYMWLCSIVHEALPDFSPCGFKEWADGMSSEKVEEADKRIKDICQTVHKHIFDTLKRKYGPSENQYWKQGVNIRGAMSKAYTKSLDDETSLPIEEYLEFIECKKIVERKDNWVLFKDVFNIPERGEKGIAKNLKWMDKVNELRRIQAHPTESRKYTSDDFEFISFIYDELTRRIALNAKNETEIINESLS